VSRRRSGRCCGSCGRAPLSSYVSGALCAYGDQTSWNRLR
jgi:hypothetical protein